jgi:rubrerythrin
MVTRSNRSSSEVLRDAIAMEVDGKEFFERASTMMTRNRSKDMFLSLVAQEKRHIEVLVHELGLLDKGLDWATLEDAKRTSASSRRLSVFSDRGVKKLELRPDAGELDVVDVGIDVEKKSIEYYRTAGQETDNANARQVFNWLVGEESGHLTILQAERDSRSGSGFHYGSMEFSLETE